MVITSIRNIATIFGAFSGVLTIGNHTKGASNDRGRKRLLSTLKMELEYNELPIHYLKTMPIDVVERAIETLKKSPRRKSIIVGAEYTRIMTRSLDKMIESAETLIRA